MSKRLSARTMGELKLIAEESGISVEGLKKAEIVEAIEAAGSQNNVITANTTRPHGKPTSGTIHNDSGAIVSAQPEMVKTTPVYKDEKAGKTAIYSERNLSWSGVGKLSKGFNFVSKEVADKWLVHRAVRKATPEEVAAHYGVS